MSNSQLTEKRARLRKAAQDYQSSLSWYQENLDSPNAEQDCDESSAAFKREIGYREMDIIADLLDEIDDLQERRKPLQDKDLQGVIDALEHPAGINAAGKQVVRLWWSCRNAARPTASRWRSPRSTKYRTCMRQGFIFVRGPLTGRVMLSKVTQSRSIATRLQRRNVTKYAESTPSGHRLPSAMSVRLAR